MVRMRIKLLTSRRLHSYSSIDHSISGLKSAFCRKDVANFVPTTNSWWRGRSYAASVASDMPGPEKDRKRVSIEVRRAMVESFVQKYKASNTGKFPSTSHTHKHVGGSFYVVRKILQELQNESTTPASSLKNGSKKPIQETIRNVNGSLTKEKPNVGGKHLVAASDGQRSSSAEKILSVDNEVSPSSDFFPSMKVVASSKNKDSKEVTSSHKKPVNVDKGLYISEPSTESHVLKKEQDVISDVYLESRSSSEELKREDPNGKEQQVQSSLKLHREKNIKNGRVYEAQPSTIESKPWGERMKSIVAGIVNMWKKF